MPLTKILLQPLYFHAINKNTSTALVKEYYHTISLEKLDSERKLCIGVLVSFMTNTKIIPQNCISQFSALIRCKNFFIHLCIFSISWVKIFPHTGSTVLGSDAREMLCPLTFRVIASENGNMVIEIIQDISSYCPGKW